jgi:hypothetical protein
VTDAPDDANALTDTVDDEPALAGSSGDDVSAGTSVSGVGGRLGETENRDAGLTPVDERAAEVAWGRDVAETDVAPPAANDGTGQSEKPSE